MLVPYAPASPLWKLERQILRFVLGRTRPTLWKERSRLLMKPSGQNRTSEQSNAAPQASTTATTQQRKWNGPSAISTSSPLMPDTSEYGRRSVRSTQMVGGGPWKPTSTGVYLMTGAFLPIIFRGGNWTIETVSSVGAIVATRGANAYETTT